eukprot:3250321-Prymnesium_polylepis.1
MRSPSYGHIWDNEIGDQGATAISEALKVNGALNIIELGNNNIGDQGARSHRRGQRSLAYGVR